MSKYAAGSRLITGARSESGFSTGTDKSGILFEYQYNTSMYDDSYPSHSVLLSMLLFVVAESVISRAVHSKGKF